MTLPEVFRQFEYWRRFPPEHEIASMFARVFTTWRPEGEEVTSEAEHRASLEARWKSGAAMNAKQIFEAMRGKAALTTGGASSAQWPEGKPPGIGPFPGQTVH